MNTVFYKYFDLIRRELGENITYDDLTLALENKLFLRSPTDNNTALISPMRDGRYILVLTLHKLGVVYVKRSKSFEKLILFLKDHLFISTDHVKKWVYHNKTI